MLSSKWTLSSVSLFFIAYVIAQQLFKGLLLYLCLNDDLFALHGNSVIYHKFLSEGSVGSKRYASCCETSCLSCIDMHVVMSVVLLMASMFVSSPLFLYLCDSLLTAILAVYILGPSVYGIHILY